jgi:signal transduction histidine kinase
MTTVLEPDIPDILDLLDECVVRRDSEGRALSWNVAAERLYGWRKDDVIGRPIDEVLKTRPIGRSGDPEIQPPIGTTPAIEMIRTTAAGVQIAVQIRWSRLARTTGPSKEIIEISRAAAGRELRPDLNSRDVSTNHRPSVAEIGEQRYRNLFQFVPVPVFRIDRSELAQFFEGLKADGVENLFLYQATHPEFLGFALNSMKIVEVNRRAIELFGARDANEVLGPAARIWSESPEICLKSMQQRYEGGANFEAQIRFRTFDDQLLDVLYLTDFPEAIKNDPIGLACLVDISDRLKAQETLQTLRAEFAHAARVSMLGELTASIVHEITQPLTAIATSGEAALLWLDRPEPELTEVRALMANMVDDAERAATIVAKVRSMSAPRARTEETLVLADVIEEAISFLHHEIQRHGVKVKLDLASDLPELNVDRIQLQQVIVNLVINAIQAMAAHSNDGRPTLAVRTRLAAARSICVEIEDDGPGISPEHLTGLFERFFTTKANGMGIGLSISRSIIEAHGGSLQAMNKSNGSGARFCFTLPTAVQLR